MITFERIAARPSALASLCGLTLTDFEALYQEFAVAYAQDRQASLTRQGQLRKRAATPGPIGVLATNATVQSRAFTYAVQSLAPERIVIEQGCSRFVPLVESGSAETPEAVEAAREYLTPLAEAGVQAIILGCTHFPFLLPTLAVALQSFANKPRFTPCFIDPTAEAVRDSAQLLAAKSLLAPDSPPARLAFAASALLGDCLPSVSQLSL